MAFRAIVGDLKLRSALHVGSGRGTETVDALLRRDARGQLLIPGTALAGLLRSLATRLASRLSGERACAALHNSDERCGCLVCRLFGEVNLQEEEAHQNESAGQNASRLLVYDAILDKSPGVRIRDGVGIDRTTGAAARRERSKFDLEVLPAHTTFRLRLEIDARLNEDKALQLLAAVLAEWQAGRSTIGGRVARGLGTFRLENVHFVEQDLNQPQTLLSFLRGGPFWNGQGGDAGWLETQVQLLRQQVEAAPAPDIPTARSWALAEFMLAAQGPFLTHDLVQAGRSNFDHAPVLAAYAKGADPLLPGASLRGVLRSQAERIARTLTTLTSWDSSADPAERQQSFLTHCPSCHPLTTALTAPLTSCSSLIQKQLDRHERQRLEQRGAEEKLCLACRLFGSTWNGSRLRVEDAHLAEGTDPEYKVLDFLAIDRFTGGGRDSAKFDAAVLWKPRFRMRLFLENPQPWELGWLALALRDLHEGLATVGFGAAKGFGRVAIQDPEVNIGFLHESDFPLPALPQQENGDETVRQVFQAARTAGQQLHQEQDKSSGLYQVIQYSASDKEKWLALANGWVKAFSDRVAELSQPPEFTHRENAKDSYFTQTAEGVWLSDLYPARVA